ncbi:MAG: hypothetical protein IT373_34005 [Polyangiaceae bacterium]|nr:hypothetical protein [Polyangiaceae bacterium]
MRTIELGLFLVALAGAAGCGGTPTAPSEDETFYLHQRGVIDKRVSWESYFPPLDRDASTLLPRRVGVALFGGTVRMSRPIDWYLRTADNTPSGRLISYQSPRQFLFSIYERTDPEGDPWSEVLKRYEEQVQKDGAQIVAGRIPIATSNAQGRSYYIKTPVASRPDYENYSHEILVRSNRRVLLVQIVHPKDIDASVDEMNDAVRSLLVY